MPAGRIDQKLKKCKDRRPLKPAGENQKKQKVLESFFFFPPAASLSEKRAVEMVVTDDVELESSSVEAAKIDVDCKDSALCKTIL